jgi:hypothetical protein
MIKVNKNGTVPQKDWPKVEALPFGGSYANKFPGFNDHIDKDGRIFRVTHPTFLKGKKVHHVHTTGNGQKNS